MVLEEIKKEFLGKHYQAISLHDGVIVLVANAEDELKKAEKIVRRDYKIKEDIVRPENEVLQNAVCVSFNQEDVECTVCVITDSSKTLQNYFGEILNNKKLEKLGQKNVKKIWTNGRLAYSALENETPEEKF